MKKILSVLMITLFSSSLFASDEKPGRFFEDQPDVTDDYQIHFIYFLGKINHIVNRAYQPSMIKINCFVE